MILGTNFSILYPHTHDRFLYCCVQIKLAQKNQDTLEKRKREREELYKRNTVLEEEEELNLELRPLPDDEVGRATRLVLDTF